MARPFIGIENAPLTKDFNNYPLLTGGALIYTKSGHTLTYVNGYYVCSKKQKGLCQNKDEKNIREGDLKKEVVNFLNKIKVGKKDAEKAVLNLVIEDTNRKLAEIDKNWWLEIVDRTIEAIKSETTQGEKISKGDLRTLKYNFNNLFKAGYKNTLLIFASGFIGSISNDFTPGRLQVFNDMAKKVYVNNSGKITSIELDGLADYALQYLKKRVPDFDEKVKKLLINRIDFPSLNFADACSYFEKNGYRNTLSRMLFRSASAENRRINEIMNVANSLDRRDKIKWWSFLRDWYIRDPSVFCVDSPIVFKQIVESFKNAARNSLS